MKILIIGSCRNNDLESKPNTHRNLAIKIGKELALRGYEVITGGAGGLQGLLINSYKKNNGKHWISYYASGEKKDKKAKSTSGVKPDKEIQTKYNFAMRDVFYIGKCDAVLALSGKLLTFAEIIHATKNYNKKVFQLAIGDNVEFIKQIKELKGKVLVTRDIQQGLNFLEH